MADPPTAVLPFDVAVQWLAWIDTGQVANVRNDLAQLIGDARAAGIQIPPPPLPPDPPSSTGPAISTR